MYTKALAVLVSFGLALTGCDVLLESAGSLVNDYVVIKVPRQSVILGGYPMVIDKTVVKISGYDLCPVSELERFFGILPAIERDCVNVGQGVAAVKVQFALKGVIHREVWSVTHDNGPFGLKRPNGDSVHGANAQIQPGKNRV
jgi:hypothetical protein